MRKLFALLFVLAVVLAACGTASSPNYIPEPALTTQAPLPYPEFPDAPESFAGMHEADLTPYLALADEVVRHYVAGMLFPLPMSTQLTQYMQRRAVEYRRFVIGHPNILHNIEIEIAWEIIDGKLLCTVGVHAGYNYADTGFVSSFGTTMQLLIENPQAPVLIDWFCPDKGSWDRAERDIPLQTDWTVDWYPLRNPEHWLINQEITD